MLRYRGNSCWRSVERPPRIRPVWRSPDSPVVSATKCNPSLDRTSIACRYLDSAKIHGFLDDQMIIGQIEIFRIDRLGKRPNKCLEGKTRFIVIQPKRTITNVTRFFLCSKSLTIFRQYFNCSVMRFFPRLIDGYEWRETKCVDARSRQASFPTSFGVVGSYFVRLSGPFVALRRRAADSSSTSLLRFNV